MNRKSPLAPASGLLKLFLGKEPHWRKLLLGAAIDPPLLGRNT